MREMPTKKQCEITGINPALLRKAKKHWEKERKRAGLPLFGVDSEAQQETAFLTSYVASLPPYPTDPDDMHCMSNWYSCYMEASYLDTYREMAANIQQQMTYGEINLTAYLDSYAACIGGTQT